MQFEEEFIQVLEREEESNFIPVIKKLQGEKKKDIVPFIKRLSKEYLEYQQVPLKNNSFTFRQKATPKQNYFLSISCFCLLNQKEYEKYRWSHMVSKEKLDPILSWYCPSWFGNLINSYSKNDWIPYDISYDWVMELSDKGHVNPGPELIVKLLPQYIYDQGEGHTWLYKPEKLVKHSITLDKHIWFLFEFENNIHFSDRFLHVTNVKDKEGDWIHAFDRYIREGKIDRLRLLRESLLATARNFNKVQTGWYAELVKKLRPTTDELLMLQKELLTTLNSNQSKPINIALSFFKKITGDKKFDVDNFIEYCPLLLASSTKAIVNATLMIVDKIGKANSSMRESLAILVCQAFIHPDSDIQSRAYKTINKLTNPIQQSVVNTINQYNGTLLSSTRNLFGDILEEPLEPAFSSDQSLIKSEIPEQTPINKITNIDELIFLASQAFDNNQPYHIDLLPATLITLHAKLTEDDLGKFDPALGRAYSILDNEWRAGMGFLDHLLVTFFITYTNILIRKFPNATQSLQKIKSDYKQKFKERAASNRFYNNPLFELKNWHKGAGESIYYIHKTIFTEAIRKIEHGDFLPLLSTPSHEPSVIDPIELVERLALYSEYKALPNSTDLQLAISRCNLTYDTEALVMAKKKLKGEILNLMLFVLTDNKPVAPFTFEQAWMTAALTKSPATMYGEFKSLQSNSITRPHLTGDFPWKSFQETYYVDRYDFHKKKNVRVQEERKKIQLSIGEKNIVGKVTNSIKKFFTTKKNSETLLYDFEAFKTRYLYSEDNDVKRLLFLFPNNPNKLLAYIIDKVFSNNYWSGETEKRLISNTLEGLIQLPCYYHEIGHLFIATCMISPDKTIRSYSGEVWINGVRRKTLSSRRLGEILGQHESFEFAPLKRFTDLVSEYLLNNSTEHNSELYVMITALLERLPDEPITNLRKLLELYLELMPKESSPEFNTILKEKMQGWTKSASLKKIISQIGD